MKQSKIRFIATNLSYEFVFYSLSLAILVSIYFISKLSYEGEATISKPKITDVMEILKVENNRYVSMFKETEYQFSNCIHSQGLRYLWECYCDDKKCLNCTIGIQGLKLKL